MKAQPVKAKRSPVARVMNMSWERADELLLANDRNRDVNESKVRRFRQLIKDGEWRLTNDAISIDNTGLMRNGQHRLMAISAEQARDMPVMLLEGVDPDDRWSYDQGLKRNGADLLAMHGKKGTNTHVAITRRMFAHSASDGNAYHMLTIQQWATLTVRFWSSVSFAYQEISRHANDSNIRGLARTGLASALARAHAAGISPDKLMLFTHGVLSPNDYARPTEKERMLRSFRSHIVREWNAPGVRLNQTEIFWFTQTVLYLWLHDTPEWPIVQKHEHLFVSSRLNSALTTV